MTAEQEPGRAAYREKVDAVLTELERVGPDAIAEHALAIRAKLTGQLATSIAKARAAERNRLELELAGALGIDAEAAAAFGWPTLISMVFGVRSIADQLIGTALPAVSADRRRDLLVSFGAADSWSRVRETAQRYGPQWRSALGLDDRGRPMGDESVMPGSPLEAELNATLGPPAEPGAAPDQTSTDRP
jgi:hypothetical protein